MWQSALADVHYVDVNSTNATPPYTNWTTAATNIQDAVDASVAGDEIVVANGIYATGGHVVGRVANRVAVDKPLNVRSVNGPQFTTIAGDGLRCVYLTNGASLFGFTLTNGLAGGGGFSDPSGGGGGAYGGTLSNCTLTGNNTANYGGGAYGCTMNNCTLAGNSAGPGSGGGAYGGTLSNCIVYFNTATNGANFSLSDFVAVLDYCCTTPLPTDSVGNITNAPLFVDTNGWSNLRLQSNSPCINAGLNALAPAGPDLDGNPRIAGGTVDIGAYEFQSPASMISYAWLQQFSLPINPSTDTADPDGDGVNNYHEWLAGTDPTNRSSSPAQLTIIPSGVPPSGIILTWPTNAVGFTLQSTTNLGSPIWSTNSPAPVVVNGQNTVTHPIPGPQAFYRLAL